MSYGNITTVVQAIEIIEGKDAQIVRLSEERDRLERECRLSKEALRNQMGILNRLIGDLSVAVESCKNVQKDLG